MATPKLFHVAMIAASALALSTPAMAEWKTVSVQHEDLDLSTAKGQERLKTRVKSAVQRVCASPRAMTLKERIDQNKCEKDSLSRAMPKAEQRIAAYAESRRVALRD